MHIYHYVVKQLTNYRFHPENLPLMIYNTVYYLVAGEQE